MCCWRDDLGHSIKEGKGATGRGEELIAEIEILNG
jgi:hypothetical protein